VLLEAMACGLPVVSTRVMGVPEVVDEGETGLLASPGRADSLAQAIELLAVAPMLRERFGRAGRRRVLEEFGLGAAVDAVVACFDEAVFGVAPAPAAQRPRERETATAAA
jgi:glycosyltransferase involved in cell wall biosynthesis